jgi:putative glutamine amidotransferase
MTTHRSSRPLVGIVCDRFFVGEHDLHSVKQSYVRALMDVSRVSPMLIPASEDIEDFEPYLDGIGGLLFPGGASNVEASRYGNTAMTGGLIDRARDHVALELMRRASSRDLPFIAVCRGFQEMNVAFGGTLDSNIYASGRSEDHRENPAEDLHTRYRYKHHVSLTYDGMLHRLTGEQRLQVNSLHMQGIETLAPQLVIEATAHDGLIESIRLPGTSFAIGVQWHPEVMVEGDAMSRALFHEFGEACRNFQKIAA